MAHEANINEAQTSILRELLFHKSAKFSQMQKQTKLTSDHFNFHIKRLIELGFVEKKSTGEYSLTIKGKEHANKLDTDNNTFERQPKVAVMLLVEKEDNGKMTYLVQERKKHPYYGYHGLPTGKIRWGETIHEAAARELEEETGLTADHEYRGIYHELTLDENDEQLEDKIFFLFKCTNPEGKFLKEFDGGINTYMTIEETIKLEKKYTTFDFELEIALGMHGKRTLHEKKMNYSSDVF